MADFFDRLSGRRKSAAFSLEIELSKRRFDREKDLQPERECGIMNECYGSQNDLFYMVIWRCTQVVEGSALEMR